MAWGDHKGILGLEGGIGDTEGESMDIHGIYGPRNCYAIDIEDIASRFNLNVFLW